MKIIILFPLYFPKTVHNRPFFIAVCFCLCYNENIINIIDGRGRNLIKIIYGRKGIGKSRKLIDIANTEFAKNGQNSVFIDKDTDRMDAIDCGIRFINATEYNIDGPKMFTGFISGIAAQDFDLQKIYINSFTKVIRHPIEELEGMFDFLNTFSEKFNVDLYISITSETPVPEFLHKYTLEEITE